MKKAGVLICLTIILFSSCSLPTSGEYGIEVRTKRITLEWDPPPAAFSALPSAVSQYYVYFCTHGSRAWHLIGCVTSSENPSIELDHSDFGNGRFDFAVIVENYEGGESRLHSSMDANARPFGGWYINWNYSD
jgi:hypothetical protein